MHGDDRPRDVAAQRPIWSAGGRATPEPATYADTGPSLKSPPVVQLPGSVVRFDSELVSTAEPLPQQRSRNFSVPPVPSSAIQYDVPVVTDVAGILTTFHAADFGAASVLREQRPDVRRCRDSLATIGRGRARVDVDV